MSTVTLSEVKFTWTQPSPIEWPGKVSSAPLEGAIVRLLTPSTTEKESKSAVSAVSGSQQKPQSSPSLFGITLLAEVSV
jgi:hypothetical protein